MVAECFVYRERHIVRYVGDIKSNNIGISNIIMLKSLLSNTCDFYRTD